MPNELPEKLSDPELLKQYDAAVAAMVSSDDVGGARQILAVVNELLERYPEFNRQNPVLFGTYDGYRIAASFVALFDLPEKEVLKLLRDNFDFVLEHTDYDLGRKIKYKIRDILSLEQRDAFKKELRELLLNLRLKLGSKKIAVAGENVEPTIANWLKDYYMHVGIDKADSLKINEYLSGNANLKLLKADEKDSLKEIFILFENLKVSSVEAPMFEESSIIVLPSGEVVFMASNQIEKPSGDILKTAREVAMIGSNLPIEPVPMAGAAPTAVSANQASPSQSSPFQELEAVLAAYPETSLEHKAIRQEISRLKAAKLREVQKSDGSRSR